MQACGGATACTIAEGRRVARLPKVDGVQACGGATGCRLAEGDELQGRLGSDLGEGKGIGGRESEREREI